MTLLKDNIFSAGHPFKAHFFLHPPPPPPVILPAPYLTYLFRIFLQEEYQNNQEEAWGQVSEFQGRYFFMQTLMTLIGLLLIKGELWLVDFARPVFSIDVRSIPVASVVKHLFSVAQLEEM